MDATKLRDKLVGDEDERAVSPVIGVILMVAITVILAAVIAAFVLDLGGSVQQEAQAGVTIDVDEGEDEIQIQVTSLGNADHVIVSGTPVGGDDSDYESDDVPDPNDPQEDEIGTLGVGDTATISQDSEADLQIATGGSDLDSGTVTAVAVIEADDVETAVASEEYDLDWD